MNSRAPIQLFLLSLTLLILCDTATLATPSQCDPERSPDLISSDTRNRTSAIRYCLHKLSKPLTPFLLRKYRNETTRVYTFGHKNKIRAMTRESKRDYWEFTLGFQSRREERKAISQFIRSENLFKLAKQYHADYYDLNDLLVGFRERERNDLDKMAFRAAALAKIYPGFINHLENGFTDTRGKSRARLRGEAVGERVSPGFDSTAGFGIYMALDPEASAEHLPIGGDCVVCDLPPNGNYINLDDTVVRANLVTARVVIPDLRERPRDAFILRPTGKNLFVSPQDFEKAAKGYLLVFKPGKLSTRDLPYIVDKFFFNFKRDCHPMTINDYSSCDNFTKLIGSAFYYGKATESLFNLLKSKSNFSKNLFHIWKGCATERETKSLVCHQLINNNLLEDNIINRPFMRQYLRNTQKKRFKEILTICDCHPSTRKGKLSFNCPSR